MLASRFGEKVTPIPIVLKAIVLSVFVFKDYLEI